MQFLLQDYMQAEEDYHWLSTSRSRYKIQVHKHLQKRYSRRTSQSLQNYKNRIQQNAEKFVLQAHMVIVVR